MKTTRFKTAGILSLSLLFMASCSKYEDGPMLSLRSKKERVANTWVIEKAMNEGENVSDNYDQFELELTKDGDATLTAKYGSDDFKLIINTDGTWEFNDSKENLIVDFENDDQDATYQILKLSEKEMWLRKSGDDLELHFEPK